ncbi:MAG: hypothetical protein ACRD1V_13510 [Vicinamibacterales bacterium]
MKSGVWTAAAVLAAGTMVGAQTPAPQQTAAESRRDAMQVMEGVLTASVRSGAAQLNRRMQAIEPSMMVLSGEARARGFLIEGYGIFFDVEIPAVNQAVIWSVKTINRDSQLGPSLALLRQYVGGINDPAARQQAEQALRQVEQQVGPIPAAQQSGTVAAASTDSTPMPDLGDPNEEYTNTIKRALVDAMLDYSASMKLGPDEWLTVAASDSEGPLMPGQLYDTATTILRVKGSDLAAYQTGKLSREDALKKVEVREF